MVLTLGILFGYSIVIGKVFKKLLFIKFSTTTSKKNSVKTLRLSFFDRVWDIACTVTKVKLYLEINFCINLITPYC